MVKTKNQRLILLKIFCLVFLVVLNALIFNSKTYARAGEMFYFGGVTEGSKLQKNIDKIVGTKSNGTTTHEYKEVVVVDGNVQVAEGTMTIKDGTPETWSDSGSYTIAYTITPDPNSEVQLSRQITLNVKYKKVDNQITKDCTINKWNETITIGNEVYTLNSSKSTLNLPTIEWIAPAITYHKVVISNELVYDTESSRVVVTHNGQSFGYNTTYSSVETCNIDAKVESFGLNNGKAEDKATWSMIVNLEPSVTMNKTLTYDSNTPYAISFDGNYLELIKNSGGLYYTITKEKEDSTLKKSELKGEFSLPTFNETEILIAPKNIDMWNGNFAEDDIRKLFSMEVLEGDTKYYVPNQGITRSQFIRLMVKALGYDGYEGKTEMAIYEDVPSSHVNYPYVVKAYEIGLIQGVGHGHFNPDEIINRQEAFVIYTRALALSNKAAYKTTVTPFIDNDQIADWAKREIVALYNLGLVKGDSGYIKPTAKLSKAEGAALVNRMIDYLREGIEPEYVENLINYD